jgi:hypothetical protein
VRGAGSKKRGSVPARCSVLHAHFVVTWYRLPSFASFTVRQSLPDRSDVADCAVPAIIGVPVMTDNEADCAAITNRRRRRRSAK